MPVIFQEEQRFQQWWLRLLIYGIVALMWWGFIQQIGYGQPWGTNPAPDWMLFLLWLLVGIGMPIFMHNMRLIVAVTGDQIDIHFRPLTRQTILLADIASVEAVVYRPIRDYGGWGIRGAGIGRIGRRVAYNVSGNQGVQLTLNDDRSVLIGSQQADELAQAIESVWEPWHSR